jgi:cysteine desulfurase/selenocysteine lyase
MQNVYAHEKELTRYLMRGLERIPGVRIIGTSPGKISVVSFVLDGLEPDAIARKLDRLGIAVRSGHHCAQPVHQCFGIPSTARASIGLYNTAEELNRLIEAVREMAGK